MSAFVWIISIAGPMIQAALLIIMCRAWFEGLGGARASAWRLPGGTPMRIRVLNMGAVFATTYPVLVVAGVAHSPLFVLNLAASGVVLVLFFVIPVARHNARRPDGAI